MKNTFILLVEMERQKASTYTAKWFGMLDEYPEEVKVTEEAETRLAFVCMGTPKEIMEAINKNPTAKYKLFTADEVPLRIAPRVYADGVDIRDFSKQG